ncbi:SulP family inorganic anion transporter [Pseudogracilibacillus auburnensis]|uniref:SulP family sulfate permease n=1 Tax=Pseudogracilibacillus auburnensis TaxID=1494959 RepID=A0A2V3W189_9BACI|nr:SulP family inorganic anion transporter [Pseudogracilibacillus auburnensis]MBO1005379.1 STAS domain-containing protein [Pseudogracilibacillus auburnensis]PXW86944.1 SulP family sulfate permease [Pseudogracilibacillus auburnensis]
MFKDDRFRGITTSDLRKDLIAGITVGVVAIPLGMAFAIASGVSPEYGIYTTIIAGLIVALLGGSHFQIAGPTGAFIPILLAVVLQYGYEDLLIAGMLAGVMLIIMSIFKFGSLITYIPRSVTIGFTSGIAVIIFSGQLENLFGLENIEKKQYFHENMLEIIGNFHTVNMYSIIVAIIGLLIIIFIPRFFPRVPVLLVALIIPALLSVLVFPGKVATIGSAFGGISQSLPGFQLPNITVDKLLYLWQPAFAIAMLGGIESLLSAVVADGMTGKQHKSNKELFGQGLANIVTPFFGGIPATGAIARTATNIKSGAVSPFSGIFQSIFVLLTLMLFAPYASHIPLASMAPILMVVAFNMSEYKSFASILKLRTSDSLVLITTFLLTIFVNLTIAVPIGLLLAMVSFVRRISGVLEVENIKPDRFTNGEIKNEKTAYSCPKIASFTIHGPLFFGAADRFESTLSRSIHKRPTVLILKMRHVSMIDVTGEANLSTFVKNFIKKKGTVLITELHEEPLEMLKRSGLYDIIGSNHFFSDTTDAINYALQLIDVKKCPYCDKRTDCRVFKKVENSLTEETQAHH